MYRLNVGAGKRFLLKTGPGTGPGTETIRMTSGTALLGCVPVLNLPGAPAHLQEDVSMADPRDC